MPLQCQKLEETFLHAYVDGEFTVEESAEVKAHLESCPACARAARRHESYKAAMLRAAGHAPHALDELLRERIAEQSERGRWARALRDPRGIAVAAAAVGAAAWFLAGGLAHPLFPRGHSLLDDGVALHARALPLDYTASDSTKAQQWIEGKLDFGVRLPRFAPGPQLQGVRLSHLHEHRAGRRPPRLAADRRRPGAATARRRAAHRRPRGVAVAGARVQRGFLAQRRDRLLAHFRPRRGGRPRAGPVRRAALERISLFGAHAPTRGKSSSVSLTPLVSRP